MWQSELGAMELITLMDVYQMDAQQLVKKQPDLQMFGERVYIQSSGLLNMSGGVSYRAAAVRRILLLFCPKVTDRHSHTLQQAAAQGNVTVSTCSIT